MSNFRAAESSKAAFDAPKPQVFEGRPGPAAQAVTPADRHLHGRIISHGGEGALQPRGPDPAMRLVRSTLKIAPVRAPLSHHTLSVI